MRTHCRFAPDSWFHWLHGLTIVGGGGAILLFNLGGLTILRQHFRHHAVDGDADRIRHLWKPRVSSTSL